MQMRSVYVHASPHMQPRIPKPTDRFSLRNVLKAIVSMFMSKESPGIVQYKMVDDCLSALNGNLVHTFSNEMVISNH